MKFSIVNGIRVVEVPVKDFRVVMYDGRKKSMGVNRCNAGFFGNYKEEGDRFTLPVGHLVCDYEATSEWTRHYCEERGIFRGGRLHYSAPLNGKPLSTLIVRGGKAFIREVVGTTVSSRYAVSGVPVLRDGKRVEYEEAVKQGWDGSSLYATMHIFAGVKSDNADTIFVLGMKTTTGNLVSSGEAASKFKAMGFHDVIKLDGGGSYYLNAGGITHATMENRRVNTILDFGPLEGNPYAAPTRTLYPGSSNTSGVYWLQWELTDRGYRCNLDGSYGPATTKQLRAYQAASGLTVDGICGPATRASLLKK